MEAELEQRDEDLKKRISDLEDQEKQRSDLEAESKLLQWKLGNWEGTLKDQQSNFDAIEKEILAHEAAGCDGQEGTQPPAGRCCLESTMLATL